MDTESLVSRIEMRQEWLNHERIGDQYRKGYSDALLFVRDWVIALEAAGEADEEAEIQAEYIREKLERDDCD